MINVFLIKNTLKKISGMIKMEFPYPKPVFSDERDPNRHVIRKRPINKIRHN